MSQPPSGVLGLIVAEVASRVTEIRSRSGAVAELERAAADAPPAPPFAPALVRDCVAIIAEVKRRSPSKGTINPGLSAADQARAYAAGGAAAISVLTEPVHFGGTLDDLRDARRGTSLPLLRKDFLIDEIQLLEARAAGASAGLLIARALVPDALTRLVAFAIGLGLEPLVEVRSEEELDRALATNATVIGINNRDLETLEIDPAVGERLLRLVPPGRVAVNESGVHTIGDVERAAAAGADAVLVGSSLSAAADPAAAVRSLAGVARRPRGR